ncbi:helix-turn-helix domain-containing protein [Saccharopolyspora shandongensis]|uniref:helix-turn-helix domain-containing protein n=1 Tax=Saccharopolyspora shandongensis TaxID=418495 RepID=UPI0033C1D419
MHVVGVPAVDGVVGFDLTTVCQVFASAWLPGEESPYDVRVCSAEDVLVTAVGTGSFRLSAPFTLDDLADADTIVVPGLRTTPLRWLVLARVHRAQELLETTDLPVEVIADHVGFGSAAVLRRHFGERVGSSPIAYRTEFRRKQLR